MLKLEFGVDSNWKIWFSSSQGRKLLTRKNGRMHVKSIRSIASWLNRSDTVVVKFSQNILICLHLR